MSSLKISTGKEILEFAIPKNFNYEILEPEKADPVKDVGDAVRGSLSSPISSPKLNDMVKPGNKVTILICDNTRYVPIQKILPIVIKELVNAHILLNDIKIVIANGTHKPMSHDEIVTMLGEEIPDKIRIINHNAYDESNLVCLGKSKDSIPIVINKHVVESDIKIGIGAVEPHLFAGYSGGVKILSVGAAGIQTIAATHNADMLENPGTKLGDIKDNIFREFLNEVARMAKLDFIVNVVLDNNKDLIKVFSGDCILAYEKAVHFAKKLYEVKTSKKADIVITVPKYPKTINLYQAVRAANGVILGAKPIVKKEGYVIIPARCWDGIGGEEFYNDLARVSDPYEVIKKARRVGFPPEGHKPFTVARMMHHCKLMITDTDIDKDKLQAMHFLHEENISMSLEKLNRDDNRKHLIILPDGCITIAKLV